MRGYIGTEAALTPGQVIVTGHNLELRLVVIAEASEEQARESAKGMGMPLVVGPGERFYEVEFTTAPVSSNN